jgi:exo-beta-1,3-glucanase (GH17 family)
MANPEDYARWVEFYNQAYDAIKRVSSETQVGPIFQYERLSGQGTFNQWTSPQWGALETHDLDKVDLVGITVYPWLGVATPEEIRDDYFDPLIEHIGSKLVAITETGWPGENLGLESAWEASPEAQIRYVEALDRALEGVDLRILNWLHLNQMSRPEGNQTFWQVFSSISLRDIEGNKRPVYDIWMNFSP